MTACRPRRPVSQTCWAACTLGRMMKRRRGCRWRAHSPPPFPRHARRRQHWRPLRQQQEHRGRRVARQGSLRSRQGQCLQHRRHQLHLWQQSLRQPPPLQARQRQQASRLQLQVSKPSRKPERPSKSRKKPRRLRKRPRTVSRLLTRSSRRSSRQPRSGRRSSSPSAKSAHGRRMCSSLPRCGNSSTHPLLGRAQEGELARQRPAPGSRQHQCQQLRHRVQPQRPHPTCI